MSGFRPKRRTKRTREEQAQTQQAVPDKRVHPITEYAGGYETARRLKALGMKDGGLVRGPGTGTSDEIEAEVPAGSYIMPADSTAQIGEQALAGMGAPVPVNLSNGEYQLPPEQVHAIGAQVLDQLKDATHTPAAQQARGFKPGTKPELFFADGGLVEDEQGRDLSSRYVTGLSKTALGVLSGPAAVAADYARIGAAKLAGGDPSTLPGGEHKFRSMSGDMLGRGVDDLASVGSGIQAKARGALGVQPAAPPQQPAPPAAAAAPTATAPSDTAQATADQEPAPPSGNDVTRDGNRYSGGVIRQGFTVNQQPFSPQQGGFTVVPPEAITAVDGPARERVSTALQAAADRGDWGAVRRYYASQGQPFMAGDGAQAPVPGRGFQAGGHAGSSTDIGDDLRQRTQAHLATRSLSGAQHRQLTASQRSMLREDQREQAQRELAGMQQAGEDRRAAMREMGASSRAAAAHALDERRLAGEEETRGFQARAAQRLERLYERLGEAPPAERSAIAEQIRLLTGRGEAPNRYTVVPGGQVIDPTTQQLVTQPAMVLNNQTGQFVPQQQGQQAPQVGEQRGGYRFKGGDPADQKNWEKI